jgi:DNA-binding transcriptional regulator LsrR (DeoR family)
VTLRYPVERGSLSETDHLILKAARLYYSHELTQAQIAERLGFSRPKVSKLLAEGRERGLVKIEIAEPVGDFAALEISLEDRYDLEEAVIVPSGDDRQSTELFVGRAGAELLSRLCDEKTSLGLSWGVSLRALADATPLRAFSCWKVVPLVGGMGNTEAQLHSNQVCADLAERVGAEHSNLAAPAIAPSARARAELVSLPGIKEVLAEGAECDVAVVGIGGILPTSTLVGAGYFTPEEFLGLSRAGIVGDVCCHFLDENGEPRYGELSARIVGLTAEELRGIPKTIGIATGPEKAPGVAAALRGGFARALVCDEDLAVSLLEIAERRGEGRA